VLQQNLSSIEKKTFSSTGGFAHSALEMTLQKKLAYLFRKLGETVESANGGN
jgi:hypothetical protein